MDADYIFESLDIDITAMETAPSDKKCVTILTTTDPWCASTLRRKLNPTNREYDDILGPIHVVPKSSPKFAALASMVKGAVQNGEGVVWDCFTPEKKQRMDTDAADALIEMASQ